MKLFPFLLILFGPGCFSLSAEPINNMIHPFPDGTVLYKAVDAKLVTVSPLKTDKQTGAQELKFTFQGKWEIKPELHGVSVSPEAGVVILAETEDMKLKLAGIESMLRARGNKAINIYILSRSVNRDGVTYAGPDSIRFE